MSVRVLAAPWVLTGGPAPEAIADGAVALDGDRVVSTGARAEVEARHGRAERLDAVILPALVNAHLHLELSHMKGWVTGGEGLPAWIQLSVAARPRAREGEPEQAMLMAAEDLVRAGVAAGEALSDDHPGRRRHQRVPLVLAPGPGHGNR